MPHDLSKGEPRRFEGADEAKNILLLLLFQKLPSSENRDVRPVHLFVPAQHKTGNGLDVPI
jgi:hypothetical protein